MFRDRRIPVQSRGIYIGTHVPIGVHMFLLGIMGWVAVGLLVGFIASKVVNLRGDDPLGGIGVAVGAGIVAATLYTLISGAGVSAWNIWSILFAALGAVVGCIVWHQVRSRYVSKDQQSTRSTY